MSIGNKLYQHVIDINGQLAVYFLMVLPSTLAASPDGVGSAMGIIAASLLFDVGPGARLAPLGRATATPHGTPTVPPAAAATPVPGAQVPHTAVLGPGLTVVVAALLILLGVLLITTLAVRIFGRDFFRIPYITWFLLHYDVATIALILVAVLGLTGTINAEVISGLYASVVGYVLGNLSGRASSGISSPSQSSFSISTASPLPGATVGTPYAVALRASGGSTPYAWSVAAGALPAGLSLESATGVVRGTPTAAGDATFAVQVLDAVHTAATKVLSLHVA